MKAHLTSACYAGRRHAFVISEILAGNRLSDGRAGELSPDHLQLCPQNPGLVDEMIIDAYRISLPGTRLRPHACMRIAAKALPDGEVWAGNPNAAEHFRRLHELVRQMGAPAYSFHAPSSRAASFEQMVAGARRVTEDWDIPVAIEGLYPGSPGEPLVRSWADYRRLMDSGAFYALDLSHLAIVARASRERHDALVAEMIACERCVEVHISGNDGRRDSHTPTTGEEWWWPILAKALPSNPGATLFSEGLHAPLRKSHLTPN